MIRQIQLVVSPYDAASEHVIRGMLAEELEVSPDQISGFKIKKKIR